MANDSLDALMQQASTAKLLSREEEQKTIAQTLRGSRARQNSAGNRLAAAFMPLVVRIAKTIHRSHEGRVDLIDLIGAGQEGLLRALEHFDAKRGARFSTYASWWIRNSIYLEVRAARWGRISDGTYRKLVKMMRAISILTQNLQRSPGEDELVAFTAWSEDEVRTILAWFERTTISLDIQVGEGNASLGDFIEDRRTICPDESLDRQALQRQLRRVLATLRPREEQIVRLYFGIGDNGRRRSRSEEKDYTFEQIAQRFQVSAERIRQIFKEALRKMRNPSSTRTIEPFVGRDSEDDTPRLLLRIDEGNPEAETA